MKKLIAFLLAIVFLTTAGIVLASPANQYGKAKTPPFPQPAEKDLQKVVFIRHTPDFYKGTDKPCDNDGICDPDEKGWCADCKGGEEPTPTPGSSCYGFLSGAKPRWQWQEDYFWSEPELASASTEAVSTWEAATSGDIFGNGLLGSYEWGVYDLVNSISYGDYPEAGVLAVTAIWFQGKRIYEYDIMFDTDYFPGPFDLNTVTLHEFGHGTGLNDLYNLECRDEVMYGYLEEGEIRSELGPGDTIGLQTLYGQ